MFLTDLADVLRAEGLTVVELDGWQERGRPASVGDFDPQGNLWHHTGGASGGQAYAEWMALTGRADLPAPLCQVAIDRDGTCYVSAAGRSNHAGTARASGPMPAGDGNELYVGFECMNTGTEGWSAAQYDAMVAAGAATSRAYGWTAAHNRAHKETSTSGKWDPGALDMDKFRRDIRRRMNHAPVRVWTANLDFATGGRADRLHLLHLSKKADVLLLQECKNIDVAALLPEGWACNQDRTSDDRAGSVIAWRTDVFHARRPKLSLSTRPFDPVTGRRFDMLTRWDRVQPLKHRRTGETYRFVANHMAPERYAVLWPEQESRLLMIRQRLSLAPVVVGTDANQPIEYLAEELNLTAHGVGIVGVLLPARRVRVLEGPHVDRFGIRRDATGHPAVGVTIQRKKAR